jgi:phage tail protein X
MLDKAWQTVERLLVVVDDVAAANRALAELNHSLPQVELICVPLGELQAVLDQQKFEAAIVLSVPGQSPYAAAYRCYLAGIPIRVGQSAEFGGGVLSHCIKPPPIAMDTEHYFLHLLQSVGFSIDSDGLDGANNGTTANSDLAHSR